MFILLKKKKKTHLDNTLRMSNILIYFHFNINNFRANIWRVQKSFLFPWRHLINFDIR